MNQERIELGNNIFVGKTIKSVDVKTVNVIFIYFTDGTSVVLEAESYGSGLYGIDFRQF